MIEKGTQTMANEMANREVTKDHKIPAKTFINKCPDVMFAKRRTERLTTRKVYETNSKATIGYVVKTGRLYGKKTFNQLASKNT